MNTSGPCTHHHSNHSRLHSTAFIWLNCIAGKFKSLSNQQALDRRQHRNMIASWEWAAVLNCVKPLFATTGTWSNKENEAVGPSVSRTLYVCKPFSSLRFLWPELLPSQHCSDQMQDQKISKFVSDINFTLAASHLNGSHLELTTNDLLESKIRMTY